MYVEDSLNLNTKATPNFNNKKVSITVDPKSIFENSWIMSPNKKGMAPRIKESKKIKISKLTKRKLLDFITKEIKKKNSDFIDDWVILDESGENELFKSKKLKKDTKNPLENIKKIPRKTSQTTMSLNPST